MPLKPLLKYVHKSPEAAGRRRRQGVDTGNTLIRHRPPLAGARDEAQNLATAATSALPLKETKNRGDKMSRFVLAILSLLYASGSIAYDEHDLVGTWKLVSAFMKNAENGEVSEAYGGPNPTGFLSYGSDHRMMAMAAYDKRIKPERVDQTTP